MYFNLTPEAREVLKNYPVSAGRVIEILLDTPMSSIPYIPKASRRRRKGRAAFCLGKDTKAVINLSEKARNDLSERAGKANLSKSDYLELLLTLYGTNYLLQFKSPHAKVVLTKPGGTNETEN